MCILGNRRWGEGKAGGGGLPLSFYFLIPSLSSPLCLSWSLSFSSLVLPIYTLLPSVVDVSWALFLSHIALVTRIPFFFSHLLVIHLIHPHFNHHHHHHHHHHHYRHLHYIFFISDDILIRTLKRMRK